LASLDAEGQIWALDTLVRAAAGSKVHAAEGERLRQAALDYARGALSPRLALESQRRYKRPGVLLDDLAGAVDDQGTVLGEVKKARALFHLASAASGDEMVQVMRAIPPVAIDSRYGEPDIQSLRDELRVEVDRALAERWIAGRGLGVRDYSALRGG